MEKIDFKQLQKIELEILSWVHDVCVEQNIRYSLAGGTLLGAVRHNGFIPWDDDIDICMPRPDYNRFIEYCKDNTTPFTLISNETCEKYSYLFAKVVHPKTIIIEQNVNRCDTELGVHIDIFPIDALCDTYDDSKKAFEKTTFARELLVAYNWKKFFRSKTRSWVYEPIRFAFFILSRFVSPRKLISDIQSKYSSDKFGKTNYSAIISGSYRLKEILPTSVFSQLELIEFENKMFYAFKERHVYLKSLYGNYMQLPPKEKQVTHHTFDAFYKTEENK